MAKNKKFRLNSKSMKTLSPQYAMSDNAKMRIDLPVDSKASSALVEDILRALRSVNGYGSIEIYIQDHSVTQITVRNIKKTKHFLAE